MFDAEFASYFFGGIAVGHEVEGALLVGCEKSRKGIDSVAQVAVVWFAERVGDILVKRQEAVCAAAVAEVGEDAAAVPDNPGGLVELVSVFAKFREIVPKGDITILPQFSTAVNIT